MNLQISSVFVLQNREFIKKVLPSKTEIEILKMAAETENIDSVLVRTTLGCSSSQASTYLLKLHLKGFLNRRDVSPVGKRHYMYTLVSSITREDIYG